MDRQLRTILDELEWAVGLAGRELAAAEQHECAVGLALAAAYAEERAATSRRAALSAASAEAALTAEAAARRLDDAWSALAATGRELGRLRGPGRSLTAPDATEGERVGHRAGEMVLVEATRR